MDFRPRLFLSHLPAVGAERLLATLANTWHRQGVDVRLGLWSHGGPDSDLPADLPVDVLGDGPTSNTAPSLETAGRALARWMDLGGGGVLMTGAPWANGAGAAARRTGALLRHTWSFVWSEVGEPQDFCPDTPASERATLDGYARLGARVADAGTAVSHAIAQGMVDRWGWWRQRVTILANPHGTADAYRAVLEGIGTGRQRHAHT